MLVSYHIYTSNYREINEEALGQALSAAVTCTILAGAGPQRSRVLATLYKVKLQSYKTIYKCKILKS